MTDETHDGMGNRLDGQPPKTGRKRPGALKPRTIVVDGDILTKLHEVQTRMTAELSFEPTLSQIIRALIVEAQGRAKTAPK